MIPLNKVLGPTCCYTIIDTPLKVFFEHEHHNAQPPLLPNKVKMYRITILIQDSKAKCCFNAKHLGKLMEQRTLFIIPFHTYSIWFIHFQNFSIKNVSNI